MRLQSILLRTLPLPPAGRALAESEYRTLVAIAEALIPDPDLQVPPEQVASNVEAFLLRGRSRRAWRIRALLHLIEWLPVVVHGTPLTRLSLEQRRRLVEQRYVDGRGLWGICAKVRYLVLLGAYGDSRMHGVTDYVPVSKRRRFQQSGQNGNSTPANASGAAVNGTAANGNGVNGNTANGNPAPASGSGASVCS